jgi:hypothetical protein
VIVAFGGHLKNPPGVVSIQSSKCHARGAGATGMSRPIPT